MADKRLLEGGVDRRILQTGDFRLLETPPPLTASATLSLSATGTLTVLGPIAATAQLALTTAAALTVPKPLAGLVPLMLDAAGILREVGVLDVNLDVFLEAFDELLVELDVIPSSEASELDITMQVQDGGDDLDVTMLVVDDALDALLAASMERPRGYMDDA